VPCRTFEYPNLRCHQIDVDSTDPTALAQIILCEGENDTSFSLAVYRDGARWTQEVERSGRIEDQSSARTRHLPDYWRTLAAWAWPWRHARTIPPRSAGSSFPPRESASADHQNHFAEWRKLGADVLVLAADVTNRESLKRALDTAHEKFGPLNGIVHAAGNSSGRHHPT